MLLRNFRGALCGLLFCIPLTATNAQTIRYVNDDAQGANTGTSWTDAYTDLQSALTAAQSGDQIWVAAGRYVGNFTLALGVQVYGGFAGTENELTQRDWKINETILDGNQTGSVVTSPPGATATTRIDGFTITNGSGTVSGLYAYGGGVYLNNSSPTIANNMITGNSASYGGGGLYLWNSSATITNNAITGNSAYYDGGGLFLWDSSPMMANNTIAGNSTYWEGGGLYLDSSSPTIANTIIAFNSSGVCQNSGTGIPTLQYNCVYGNGIYNYSHLTDPTGTDGNISADPMLVRNPSDGGDGWGDDPATPDVDEGANDDFGDLRMRAGSPAINAGDPGFVPQPGETDLDGHARVLCGRVDMGAYEFGIGDYDCDQSVDMADFAAWDTCMGGPSGAELRMANGEERMTLLENRNGSPSPQPSPLKGEGVGPRRGFDDPGQERMTGDGRSAIGMEDLRFENGPGAPGSALRFDNPCAAFDFDADGDTDLRDFAGFQRVFAGQ